MDKSTAAAIQNLANEIRLLLGSSRSDSTLLSWLAAAEAIMQEKDDNPEQAANSLSWDRLEALTDNPPPETLPEFSTTVANIAGAVRRLEQDIFTRPTDSHLAQCQLDLPRWRYMRRLHTVGKLLETANEMLDQISNIMGIAATTLSDQLAEARVESEKKT